jgi:alpha-L-fucosidase
MGSELPKQFNPTALDCRQWARVCKEAGMKGIILTAKHHDGFCLWPSKYTGHSVKNSPWKDGKGDVVRELSDACREHGLKFGIYLSPWDRNHPDYGRPEYLAYFRNQLRELLTDYGEVFEVWFDGANGGDGYYGGANEKREVDRQTYYDWPTTHKLVHELQPNAVIFSDAGPGCRWVGNEDGYAGETNWSALRLAEFYPGSPNYKELTQGHADGTHWVPAECDVSIRPGWYYHPEQDDKVKSLEKLTDIYYHSVGRNGLLLLNLPVDTRGLVHEADAARLRELRAALDRDFATNFAEGSQATATAERGPGYAAALAVDGNPDTYWAAPDGTTSASLLLAFGKKRGIGRVVLQEPVRLGQRVTAFRVFAERNGGWERIAEGTTIGYKRIIRFAKTDTERLKIELEARAVPCIAEVGAY